MARPGKKRVEVYFDLDDYEKLQQRSSKAFLTVSEFIRKSSLEGEIIVYDMKTINQLIFEINKIGVNINQIARKVNQFDTIHKVDIQNLYQEFDELCHMLNQFLFDRP